MAGKSRFTHEQKQEMCRLYQNGMTTKEVGEGYNCSPQTVSAALKENNIKTRKSEQMKSGDSDEFDRKLAINNPSIIRLGPLGKAKIKILFKCLKHNEEHEATPDNMLRGKGLKCCGKASRSETGRNRTETAIEATTKKIRTAAKARFIEWLNQNKPNYSLSSEYEGPKSKCLVNCSTHGEKHKITPAKLMNKNGMLTCCEVAFMKKFGTSSIKAARRIENSSLTFDKKLAENNPKLKRIGEYKGSNVHILFHCLTHNEEHLATPQNSMHKGLKCCQIAGVKKQGEAKKETSKQSYDQRLAEIGEAVRIGEYVGSGVPILHRCLIHDEIHPIAPGHALKKGEGMACCLEAKRKIFNEQKIINSGKKHDNFLLANVPYIERLEPYLGAHVPILHRCHKCNEEHQSSPVNARQKKGLACCKRKAMKSHAQQRAREGLVGYDDIWMLLSTQYKKRIERASEIYIFELKNHPGLLKPGIAYSHQSRRRGSEGEYADEPLAVWEFESRTGPILVEQAIKQRTSQHWEGIDGLEDWAGFNEVRRMNAEQLIGEVQYAVDSYQSHIEEGLPWQSWALENLQLPATAIKALNGQINQSGKEKS